MPKPRLRIWPLYIIAALDISTLSYRSAIQIFVIGQAMKTTTSFVLRMVTHLKDGALQYN